jgi:hypothetical protein
MNKTEEYNCTCADLYNAERRLDREFTVEQATRVAQLKAKRDRLAVEIRASGPSVADIHANVGVLL